MLRTISLGRSSTNSTFSVPSSGQALILWRHLLSSRGWKLTVWLLPFGEADLNRVEGEMLLYDAKRSRSTVVLKATATACLKGEAIMAFGRHAYLAVGDQVIILLKVA